MRKWKAVFILNKTTRRRGEKCKDNSNPNRCESYAPRGSVETAQEVLIGSLLVSTATAFINSSSPTGVLSLFNHYQLLNLIAMLPSYLPTQITQFILGNDFAMLSFDFIPNEKIPFIGEIPKWIPILQSDPLLNEIGLNSKSSIFNYLSIFLVVICIVFLYLMIAFLYSLLVWRKKEGKCMKWMKKIFQFFTFNIYIMLLFEKFMFINM